MPRVAAELQPAEPDEQVAAQRWPLPMAVAAVEQPDAPEQSERVPS